MNLLELFVNWQHYMAHQNLALNTIQAYKRDFIDFKNFYLDYQNVTLCLEKYKALTIQDIRAWLLSQRKKQKNPRSVARGLGSLKNFTQYLVEQEVLIDHAFLHVRYPRIQKTLPRPVSVDQAILLSETVGEGETYPWIASRNRALMNLLYFTGLRISEALSLNQVSLASHQFISVLGKGGKMRQVPVSDTLHEILKKYLDCQPFLKAHAAPLFYGEKGKRLQPAIVQKILRDFRRSNGFPESLTPHALRHSCASHLMQSSQDLRGIQELLGHSSLSSTQIYTQIDERSLMRSYKNAHPRAGKA